MKKIIAAAILFFFALLPLTLIGFYAAVYAAMQLSPNNPAVSGPSALTLLLAYAILALGLNAGILAKVIFGIFTIRAASLIGVMLALPLIGLMLYKVLL